MRLPVQAAPAGGEDRDQFEPRLAVGPGESGGRSWFGEPLRTAHAAEADAGRVGDQVEV